MDRVYNAMGKIKQSSPNLVERLLDKQRTESPDERQTIYGDVVDWVRDMYSHLSMNERDELVKRLLADYVIHHPTCLTKVYILLQESNVDGEIYINATPCASLEAARRAMKQEVFTILHESLHYSGYCDSEFEESFEIEQSEDSYYINDLSDDYYEDLKIIEKDIIIK